MTDAQLTDGRLSPSDTIDAPLWWHEPETREVPCLDCGELPTTRTIVVRPALQETASGYGAKLTTRRKIRYSGRLYRVYCTIYGNAGSCWICCKGEKIFFWDF